MSNKTLDIVEVHKVNCDGNEISFITNPKDENTYLGIVSRKQILADSSIEHAVFLVYLDEKFKIANYVLLKTMEEEEQPSDNTDVKQINGIQNCILLNENMFMALVYGRTELKIPMICLCHFKGEYIHTITPFDTAGSLNPIILKYNLTNIFAIHSYSPFKIMSLNMDTGANQIVNMVKVFNEEKFVVERGAATYLDDYKEYLLALRVEKDGKYLGSFWVTLTERFKLHGISPQFLFNMNYKKNSSTKTTKTGETCTGLLVKNKTLYTSLNIDNEIFVYEYSLENVHKIIVKV
jgi:hypothetical protein